MSCPEAGDGEHWWHVWDPPEWMNTHDWDDDAWRAWYEDADATCYRCGEVDER